VAIKLASDTIDSEDLKALSDWILTNPRLTKGDLTIEFEKKFASTVGAKHAVFVNSGSSANLMMLYAAVLTEARDITHVAVPALSWATDVAPIIQLGLVPVYIDCSPNNLGMDINDLKKKYKKYQFEAVLTVSVLGFPPSMNAIKDFCETEGIILLEDNCESFGTVLNDTKIGSHGEMSTWSTYFGHHFSTIEGGLVTTNDDTLYQVLLQLRSHGWIRDLDEDTQKKYLAHHEISEFEARYKFFLPGFNFRNTEIGAFLGLRQLDKATKWAWQRHRNYQQYCSLLKNYVEWLPPYCDILHDPSNLISNFAFPIVHRARKYIERFLTGAGVECRPLIAGSMTKQPMCLDFTETQSCPWAEYVNDYGMYVPNHHKLTEKDITDICSIIQKEISAYERRNPS
jgi:CDP-6-deoxy-D-xylo-4-hexulose-3-dehydrase